MILLILVAAGVAWWAWRSGQLRALRFGDVAAAIGALCGIRLLGHGEAPIGILALAGAGGWLWLRTRGSIMPATGGGSADDLAEARGVLEVPLGADRAEVERAYRRLIGRVHPDAGGSNELARQVTGARDALLADLDRRPPRAR